MRRIVSIVLLIALIPALVVGESPRISIPGLSDDFDSNELIDALLEVEQMKIDDKTEDIEEYEITIDIIEDFTTYVDDLSTRSKTLYDYQSPFGDMLGTSSDPTVLDATANRTADSEEYIMEVLQLANVDSFMSDSIYKSKQLPACDFQIIVGEEIIPIDFEGGTVYQLEKTIESEAEDIVEIRILSDTSTTAVLTLSGVETGASNAINFDGDVSMLQEIGLLMEADSDVNTATVDFTENVPESERTATASKDEVILGPETEVVIDLESQNIEVEASTTLTFDVEIETFDSSDENSTQTADESEYPNLSMFLSNSVTISNITVEGGELFSYFIEAPEPYVPEKEVTNFTRILSLQFTDGAERTYSIETNGNYELSLSVFQSKTIESVTLNNENTDRQYTFSDMEFETTVNEGGIQPVNTLSKAQDAIFTIDGVQIIRDNNEVDDVIESVTLFLFDESEEEITLTIDHDYELVAQTIVDWVYSYNQVMEYLSILTKPTSHEDELAELDEDEQKQGLFATESSFSTLKSKLRTVTMDAYETDLGRELTLLQQIGIYTKIAGTFSTDSDEWLTTQMGLLNLDSDDLSEELAKNFDAVEQLFACDTDGDYIKDTGVAYSIYNVLKLANETGTGFLERLVTYNEDKIDDLDEEIEELETELEDYETQLRDRYATMNQTISSTQDQSEWFSTQMQGMTTD